MQMLNLRTLTQPLTNIHVVQGLAILIKQVGVALSLRQTNHLVQINKARLGGKRLERLDLREFVKVTSRNDPRLGVLGEDVRNEFLQSTLVTLPANITINSQQ